MEPSVAQAATALIEAALRGELTEAQARPLYAEGPEAVVLALLATAKRIAEQNAQVAGLPTPTPDGWRSGWRGIGSGS